MTSLPSPLGGGVDVEQQLGLHRGGDVVVVVRVAGEVELGGHELVAGRRHLEVQVGGAPGVPAGGGDQLAAGAVGRDLVRRGLERVHPEAALVVGDDGAAQVPLRDARGELRVEALGVRVPDLDRGAGQRRAVDAGDLALEEQRGAGLGVAHRQGGLADRLGGAGHVVGALDGALAALAVLVGDLLDHVLDPHVEEERPLAVLADADQPRLERVVLVVGHLVLADGRVQRLDHLAGEGVHALRRGGGHAGELVGLEALGGGGTRGGRGRGVRAGAVRCR